MVMSPVGMEGGRDSRRLGRFCAGATRQGVVLASPVPAGNKTLLPTNPLLLPIIVPIIEPRATATPLLSWTDGRGAACHMMDSACSAAEEP